MATNDEIAPRFPAGIRHSSFRHSLYIIQIESRRANIFTRAYSTAAKVGRQAEKVLNNKKMIFKQTFGFKVR